ncbi:MAG: (cytosine-5-)-methyltransferase, partial [Verrucomicrobiota bacterium]
MPASSAQNTTPAPRFIDLFCGIGGFRLAFEKIGGRCVFSSDWDKYSRLTYAANFGETPHGDIHSVAVRICGKSWRGVRRGRLNQATLRR